MNKKLLIGAAAGCATIAAVATKKRFAGPRATVSDKCASAMEKMPENFPPRMMFDNVQATRTNTERTLELLENQPPVKDDTEVSAPTRNGESEQPNQAWRLGSNQAWRLGSRSSNGYPRRILATGRDHRPLVGAGNSVVGV